MNQKAQTATLPEWRDTPEREEWLFALAQKKPFHCGRIFLIACVVWCVVFPVATGNIYNVFGGPLIALLTVTVWDIVDMLKWKMAVSRRHHRRFWEWRWPHRRDISKEMAEIGYTVALTEEQLMNAGLPVIGILAPDNLPVAEERGDLYRNTVRRGLDILSRESGDKGFVMMLEGSCIDDWLHGNDIGKAMEELLDFDRTIGDVLKWAEADGHTLVVVTADHATGCLTLQDGDLEKGEIGVYFASESHNGIAVPIYAWGPGSEAFTGIKENEEWGRIIASFVK